MDYYEWNLWNLLFVQTIPNKWVSVRLRQRLFNFHPPQLIRYDWLPQVGNIQLQLRYGGLENSFWRGLIEAYNWMVWTKDSLWDLNPTLNLGLLRIRNTPIWGSISGHKFPKSETVVTSHTCSSRPGHCCPRILSFPSTILTFACQKYKLKQKSQKPFINNLRNQLTCLLTRSERTTGSYIHLHTSGGGAPLGHKRGPLTHQPLSSLRPTRGLNTGRRKRAWITSNLLTNKASLGTPSSLATLPLDIRNV